MIKLILVIKNVTSYYNKLISINQRLRFIYLSFLIFLLGLSPTNLFSQNTKIDSLKTIIVRASEDSTKVNTLLALSAALFDEGIKNLEYTFDNNILKPNNEESLKYALKAEELSRVIGYTRGQANAFRSIGNSYKFKQEYVNSIVYNNKSYESYKGINDTINVLNSLLNLGDLYSNFNFSSTKAEKFLLESLELASKIKDTTSIRTSLLYMSNFYLNNKKSDKAIESLNKLKLYIDKDTDSFYYFLYAANLGKAYFFSERFEEARINYLWVLDDRGGTDVQYSGNLGDIELALGNTDKAIEYFNSQYEVSKQEGNVQFQISSLVSLGNIYQKKSFNKAMDAYKEAERLSKENSISERSLGSIYDGMAKSFSTKGDYRNAYKLLNKSQIVKDSIKSKKQENNDNQGLFDFDIELQEKKIDLLEKDGIIKDINAKRQRYLIYGTVITLILILLLTIGIIKRYRYAKKTNIIIQKERDRSENLLLNILPAEIVQELKDKGKADARDFDMASIIFTDFKGFTKASEKLNAQELVYELNTCFEAFDGIMTNYGLEKIKTIGDAYMAVGGLPIPTDNSVKKTVLAALEMQAFIIKRKIYMTSNGLTAFEMRAGIHTGPVVAGIVGVKKYQYDIWGDTVNTASRMESSGEVEKVNISQVTYELLKDDPDFAFENRGRVEAKGKGEIEMWFVSLKKKVE